MTDYDQRFAALSAIAHRVAFRVLGDRAEAAEVAQEAMARAYVRWASVAQHAEPWVARVATNLAIGVWRRRRPTLPLGDAALGSDAMSIALERHGLVAALTRLPRRQREVLALRYLADLPEAEVADQLRTSVGTVKQHAHRGLARLRAELGFELEEVPDVRTVR
jgi:RNA polymerase sigma-70 factor (ECF subfamily)